jgi:NADH-quinone oxidoreductase subunit L
VSALLLILLVVPFTSAGITLFVGHRSDVAGKGIALGGSVLGLALACGVAFAHLGNSAPYAHVYSGSSGGGPTIELSLYVDQLSAVTLLLANVVAFLVQLYSLGYLADDSRYPSYAALVSIFTGAMSTVVVADDLWVLLVGWELMGACSYFLISHHWELPEARAGAVKAFLMTRTADLGLLFAIIVLGDRFGSYRISTIMAAIVNGAFPRDDLWLPAVLITIAVVGKSAQFPLHTWLPDAMPGPTPISALIHAATMVAAGVFLVARTYPLFLSAPSALTLLAGVAAVTMFIAAIYALFTDDLKRVLAWSTVSQLAYMFGALAVGAYSAGVFHLLAHGAFKALLFLSAGSVVHAVGGSTSMKSMGGLRDKMPDTFITMTIGFAALAGVVPFVGFFTKDAVITSALDEATNGNLVWPWVAWLLVFSTVVTALLTVAYSLRAWLLVFFGRPAPEAEDPHEPPWTMRFPLYVLAVPTAIGGVAIAYPASLLGSAHDADLFHASTAIVMTVLVALVIALVVWTWRKNEGGDLWQPHQVPHPQVDRLYDVALVRPIQRLARVVRAGDRDVIDASANRAGWTAAGLGRVLRLAQNGNVQSYLMVVVVGAAAIAVAAGVLS